MKVFLPVVAALVLALFFLPGAVCADTAKVWPEQRDIAVQGLLDAVSQGASGADLSRYLRKLVMAEAAMVTARQVSYLDHDNLYGHLAKGLTPSQIYQFPWRVARQRLARRGVELAPAASSCPREAMIFSRNSGQSPNVAVQSVR